MGGAQYLFQTVAHLAGLASSFSFSLRLVLATLFVVGGVYKLRRPLDAAIAAVNFGILKRPWKPAGYAFGIAELCLGVLLLSPSLPLAAAALGLSTGLSVGFAFVTGRALAAGGKFSCHCLPGSDGELSSRSLWRAIAMIVASVASALGLLFSRMVVPQPPSIAGAAGLAAVILGIPLAVTSAAAVWVDYRHFMVETDWEWVIQLRALGGKSPAFRPQPPRPAPEGTL
jgi:hypothetical protein